MIMIIAGATHTGKTRLAQWFLEQCHYPYFSLDHLKMGLIRSGKTDLTVFDDEKMTAYLWPIVREMIKTAIENGQNLIVEGCYIPFDWKQDFEKRYLDEITCRWLIFSEDYIRNNFDVIREKACVIEQRLDDSGLNIENMIAENRYNLEQCRKFGCDYILVHKDYEFEMSGVLS